MNPLPDRAPRRRDPRGVPTPPLPSRPGPRPPDAPAGRPGAPSRRGLLSVALALAWAPLGTASAQVPTADAPPARAPQTLPVEVELRQLCSTVVHGIHRISGHDRARQIMVAPFGGDDARATRDVRRLLTDYLSVVCLGGARDLVVVRSDAALETVDDPSTFAGRAAEAGLDMLIRGAVTRGAVAYTVTAHLVDTRTGESASTVMHPLPLEATDAYVTRTMRPRTPAAAALRAAVVPGWGQFYNEQPTKGALVVSAEVVLLAAAAGFFIARDQAWQAYHVQVPERVAYKADAEQYETWAIVAVGLASAVWIGSIVDAWLSGYRYDPESVFDRRSSVGPAVGGGGPPSTAWGIRW